MDEVSEIPSAFKSIKNNLIEEFPKEKIEGLNTKRVEDFIQAEGLEVKPYIIFDRKDLRKINKIVGNTGLLRSTFDNGESGLYSPETDLVLIARDRKYEESSGAVYTEGLLVHELTHASSMYQGHVAADYNKFYTPRVGFCLPQNKTPWGWLLEEGWADIHRANYFAKNASDTEKAKLEKTLRFGSLEMTDTVPITTPAGETLPLPIKYFYITPEGNVTTKSSAFAAYALELLFEQEPALKSLLTKGRNSVEGLRNIAQAFEKIMPGLYKSLQTADYTEASFSEKLSTVITDVVGDVNKAVKAKGELRNKWDNLLSE